jgi:hypothetical protein
MQDLIQITKRHALNVQLVVKIAKMNKFVALVSKILFCIWEDVSNIVLPQKDFTL